MIEYRIKEMMLKKEKAEKRRITWQEVASCSGVSRTSLYRMTIPGRTFNASAESIKKLCDYFGCSPNDLVSFSADEEDNTARETADETAQAA